LGRRRAPPFPAVMLDKVRDQRNGGRLGSHRRQPGFIYRKGFPIAQNHDALDYILQLAEVARPVVSLEQVPNRVPLFMFRIFLPAACA